MGLIAVLFTTLGVLAGLLYVVPRWLKRRVAVTAMRTWTPVPDAAVHWKMKVFLHSPALKQVAPNVWTLVASLPPNGPRMKRRMVVVRTEQGLCVHSPICVNQSVKDELNSLGKVASIIVPNEMHRLDAAAWAREYPDAKVVCPSKAITQVSKAVKVSQTVEDTFTKYDPSKSVQNDRILYMEPKGLYPDAGELVYFVKHEGSPNNAHSLIMCDLLFNIDPTSNDCDPILLTIGTACGFGCTAIGRFMFVENKDVARKWAEEELAEAARKLNVLHISVAHGDDLVARECDASVKTLRRAASTFQKAHE
ncbi:hypothetical protein HDU79_010950 [Rhizoclosmatium sp. JEL0117]|nr:hypothetical protein HDU79_010950 [Rhizoclosmatium sp. JEL0117]